MKYENMEPALFLERPNRFVAYVEQAGRREICHVKNTGRCKELLLPGAELYVQRSSNPNRKTPIDLIVVRKGQELVNMDSQVPNKVVEEWLRKGNLCGPGAKIRPECKYGNSRFDFFIEDGERRIFMEVKGVTLEEDGTERGVKHIRELIKCKEQGYEAYVFFVIQMKGVTLLEPNDRTHPEFGAALREAKRAGVQVLAYDCLVSPDEIVIDKEIEVRL